jgi:hypothetical protein
MLATVAALACVGMLTAGCGPAPAPQSGPSCLRVVVPAYFHASSPDWDTLIAAGDKVDTVILNPASGPGTHRDRKVAQLVRRSRGAGQHLLGYVATGRGNRDPGAVTSEIDDYRKWYGIHGVFLDEAATSPDKLPIYRRYARYIHDHDGRAVLNPGVIPARGYFDVGDAVVTFEGTASDYRDRPPPPPWLGKMPARKLWHLITDAPSSAVSDLLGTVRAGSEIDITDDAPPNSYDRLPSYLHQELESARGGCTSG